jgi:hypothetical protein
MLGIGKLLTGLVPGLAKVAGPGSTESSKVDVYQGASAGASIKLTPAAEALVSRFPREIGEMMKSGAISPADLAEAQITPGRARGTDASITVLEGAPVKEMIGTIEIEKRPVFLLADDPRTLFPGPAIGRGAQQRPRWVAIDQLPRPQDRHERSFDLDDGRSLLAWELWTPFSGGSPMHVFLPGDQHGPAAIQRLVAEQPPWQSSFYATFKDDVQALMNNIMFAYPREVFEAGTLYALKSEKTGIELYVLELPTEMFGTHHLWFSEDLAAVAKEPTLRDHQVTRELMLSGLDLERLGDTFSIVKGGKDGDVGRGVSLVQDGDRVRFALSR